MRWIQTKIQQCLWASVIGVSTFALLDSRLLELATAESSPSSVMPIAVNFILVEEPLFCSIEGAPDTRIQSSIDDQFETRLYPGQSLVLPEIGKRALAKKSRLSRKSLVSIHRIRRVLAEAFMEWDAPAAEASLAPNVHALEDDLLKVAMEESLDRTQSSIDWRLEGSQLDIDASLGFQLTRWEMPVEIVGRFKKADFTSIRAKLDSIRKQAVALKLDKKEVKPVPPTARAAAPAVVMAPKPAPAKTVAKKIAKPVVKTPIPAPQSEAVIAAAPPVTVTPAAPTAAKPSVEAVRPTLASADFAAGVSESLMSKLSEFASEAPVKEEAPVGSQTAVPAAPPVLDARTELEAQPTIELQPPTPVVAETTKTAPQAVLIAPLPSSPTPQNQVLAANPVNGRVKANLLAMNTQTTQPTSVRSTELAPRRTATLSRISRNDAFGTTLEGKVTVEEEVEAFLASKNAALDIFLVPITGSEKRDLIPVMSYPEQVFRFPAQNLKGVYRLVALALAPDNSEPVGRAVYDREIKAETAKESIRFDITLAALLSGATQEVGGRLTVPVTLSIFEGASAESREPKPIAGATVRIAGLPEWGEFKSDKDGDVSLPEFPIHSRLLFVVSAPDKYLPTTKAVSVGTRDPGGEIFLIQRSQAEALSWMLPDSKEAVNGTSSVVMGRVYDPITHMPLEGQRISVEGHDSAKWAYVGPAADANEPRTQSEGFFSFFRVASGFNYLSHLEKDLRSFRMQLRPGSGYYVELGKLGVHLLQGLVETFFDRKPIAGAELQLVGDNAIFGTSNSGKFQVHGVEFPAGRATIEFRRQGYPMTWHTVPYNPLDRMRARKYSMLTTDEVNRILIHPGSPKWNHSTGMLVGKALGSLFDLSKDEKLEVEVRTPSGKPVSQRHGPFTVDGSDPATGLTKAYPAFAYWNLPPGEYIVIYRRAMDGQIVRIELTDLGRDRVSIVY